MNLLYEQENGVDARIKPDATHNDLETCYRTGSKRKRQKIRQERVNPVIHLEESNSNKVDEQTRV
eukprot:scaffold62670_cov46-Attheya_sp.AAC.1